MNNYLIFKYSFLNALNGLNLYAQYPHQYVDSHHYGPLFSLIIAPFAILKGNIGVYLWQIFNVSVFFYAIQSLPLSTFKKNIICLICTQELIISLKEFQTNGAIAALIILAWIMVESKKEFWAALFIMLGLFVKLYGVIGIVFFLLSKQKLRFITSLLFWGLILFVLPMLFFSPQFVANSYLDWYHSLVEKNVQNTDLSTMYQDVSVMGMIRRIAGHQVHILPLIVAGGTLFVLSCFKVTRFNDINAKLLLLSSCLLFVVLFSTSSEQVTYVIAFAGIAIWFMSRPLPLTRFQVAIFVFALYFGSLFRTDLFPRFIKNDIILPYALKALPCLIVWLAIIFEMIKRETFPIQLTLSDIKSKSVL